MTENSPIEFLRKKDFRFRGYVGQGGTGKTILIEDEIIGETFICKKYSPFYDEHKEQYFEYFLNEIKILHTIYHKNIVRVFNYYLYPEKTTGYIIMEFVNGKNIGEFLSEHPDKLEDIFAQTIEGFKYLEENKILHRDIRPNNILVSEDGIVKIIDFGFGKPIAFEGEDKSITLNWRYSVPEEFRDRIYDFKSEIYFVGKLFEEILQSFERINFKYTHVVNRMVFFAYNKRPSSFLECYRLMLSSSNLEDEFTFDERMTYSKFAIGLASMIKEVSPVIVYEENSAEIIRDLEQLHRDTILETEVQNNQRLINIFIHAKYKYVTAPKMGIDVLNSFTKFIKLAAEDKQKIILNNLWQRFDMIKRDQTDTFDLPF